MQSIYHAIAERPLCMKKIVITKDFDQRKAIGYLCLNENYEIYRNSLITFAFCEEAGEWKIVGGGLTYDDNKETQKSTLCSNNINRFSRHQTVSNTGILLRELASVCMEYLEYELYGTSYKHGFDNTYIKNNNGPTLASLAAELLQEIGITKKQLLQAWDDAQKNRKELEEISKEEQYEQN
jgi:hypothetical protein